MGGADPLTAGTETPPPDDIDRIERALGWRPSTFRSAVADRGVSATAARWIVGGSGGSAFVKIGATSLTADWIRAEFRNYQTIRGPFMAEVLGFDDDRGRPALALEDLSAADWPPPWTEARVAMVREAFEAIRTTPPPDHLGRVTAGSGGAGDWDAVAADPREFLSLGIATGAWLAEALPLLRSAAARAPLAGDALIHLDVRGDNVCFRDDRALVIDWNHAAIGNPDYDIAFWLPSLAAEGGPLPESILPDAPELAAWVAGFFCARAGGPPIPEAPHVRPLQLAQARTALPWAARALGLPPPR